MPTKISLDSIHNKVNKIMDSIDETLCYGILDSERLNGLRRELRSRMISLFIESIFQKGYLIEEKDLTINKLKD